MGVVDGEAANVRATVNDPLGCVLRTPEKTKTPFRSSDVDQLLLTGVGFSVSVNQPYKGGELTRRYGDPQRGIHSVLIEINKKLFMDVKTFKKTDAFSRVQGNLTRVLQAVAESVKDEAAAV